MGQDGVDVHDTTESDAARSAVLDELNGIPKEELEELASQWREDAEKRDEDPDASPIRGQVLRRCAGEVERLLDNDA